MTAPSPTPTEIAKCPNCKERCGLMDGDDGFFVECDGNTSLHEQSNFEPWANGAPCGYRGPLSPDEAEAIRLHNALCRPAHETQAVATVSKASGAFRLEWCGDFKNLQDGDKLYRSPVESAPALAPFEKLAADLLAEAEKMVPSEYADRGLHGKYYRIDTEAAGLVEAADRLSAKIEEVRGK